MTDTVTETEATPTSLENHPDETIRKFWEKVKSEEPNMREAYAALEAGSPPPASQVDEIIRTSEDPELTKLRKEMEETAQRLEKLQADARDYVLSGYESLPDDEVEKLKERFRTSANKIKTILGLIKETAETLDIEGVEEAVKAYDFPSLRSVVSRSSSTGSEGAMGPRPKANVRVTKPGKEAKEYPNLSFAATYLGIPTGELYAQWMSHAGTDKWQDVKEPTTFTVERTPDGEVIAEVTISPK